MLVSKKILSTKSLYFFLIANLNCFIINNLAYGQSYITKTLPKIPSQLHQITQLKGFTINPDDFLDFDFHIHTGNTQLTETDIRQETKELLQYFLTCLTIPNNELWVNLSPHEPHRITTPDFGKTALAHELLDQDNFLKTATSALLHPDHKIGKIFWDNLSQHEPKTANLNLKTFQSNHKFWIMPDIAEVHIDNYSIMINKTRLKVLLEEDYIISKKIMLTDQDQPYPTSESSRLLEAIIIPAIEDEVNHSRNFSKLRQIYHSFILAAIYKNQFKKSLLGTNFVDKKFIKKINLHKNHSFQDIYNTYNKNYREGVFNFIKEDYDPDTQEIQPKKYFAGGVKLNTSQAKIISSQINNEPTPKSLTLIKEFFAEIYDTHPEIPRLFHEIIISHQKRTSHINTKNQKESFIELSHSFIELFKVRAAALNLNLSVYLNKIISNVLPNEKSQVLSKINLSLTFANTQTYFDDTVSPKKTKKMDWVLRNLLASKYEKNDFHIRLAHIGPSTGEEIWKAQMMIDFILNDMYEKIYRPSQSLNEWKSLWNIESHGFELSLENIYYIQQALYHEKSIKNGLLSHAEIMEINPGKQDSIISSTIDNFFNEVFQPYQGTHEEYIKELLAGKRHVDKNDFRFSKYTHRVKNPKIKNVFINFMDIFDENQLPILLSQQPFDGILIWNVSYTIQKHPEIFKGLVAAAKSNFFFTNEHTTFYRADEELNFFSEQDSLTTKNIANTFFSFTKGGIDLNLSQTSTPSVRKFPTYNITYRAHPDLTNLFTELQLGDITMTAPFEATVHVYFKTK